MKKNGRLVAIALGSVLCASCVGGAFFVEATNNQQIDLGVNAASQRLVSKTAEYTVSSKTSVTGSGDTVDGSSAKFSQTYENTVGQITKKQ